MDVKKFLYKTVCDNYLIEENHISTNEIIKCQLRNYRYYKVFLIEIDTIIPIDKTHDLIYCKFNGTNYNLRFIINVNTKSLILVASGYSYSEYFNFDSFNTFNKTERINLTINNMYDLAFPIIYNIYDDSLKQVYRVFDDKNSNSKIDSMAKVCFSLDKPPSIGYYLLINVTTCRYFYIKINKNHKGYSAYYYKDGKKNEFSRKLLPSSHVIFGCSIYRD